jgi:hypothetical protein
MAASGSPLGDAGDPESTMSNTPPYRHLFYQVVFSFIEIFHSFMRLANNVSNLFPFWIPQRDPSSTRIATVIAFPSLLDCVWTCTFDKRKGLITCDHPFLFAVCWEAVLGGTSHTQRPARPPTLGTIVACIALCRVCTRLSQQSLTLNDYRVQPVALAPFGPTNPTSAFF